MLMKLSKNAGAKIVVHDPTLPPLPDEYGIDLQPNSASSIAIQTVRFPKFYTVQFWLILKSTSHRYQRSFQKQVFRIGF